jgi:CelD/BcsL family acetyltransferase involved in cellulose biosynthesis
MEPVQTITRDSALPSQEDAPPKIRFRRVGLTLWLGPLKLATIGLPVMAEMSPFDPSTVRRSLDPDLSQLPPDVVGIHRTSEIQDSDRPNLSRSGTALRYVDSLFDRRFIDMDGDFDGYLAKFSSKTRSTLRRKQRKFETASGGKIDWRIYRSPQEMAEFHALARQISRLTYQEKLYDAGIPEGDAFVAALQDSARRDSTRGFVLFLKGRPISYLYCPIETGRVKYGFLGYDPTCAQLSPGTVLQMLALESLFGERKYRIFDFTEGEGEHKKLFSTGGVRCASVFYLRPTVRNYIVLNAHRVLSRGSRNLERLVKRLQLKLRLRRALRRQEDKKADDTE